MAMTMEMTIQLYCSMREVAMSMQGMNSAENNVDSDCDCRSSSIL